MESACQRDLHLSTGGVFDDLGVKDNDIIAYSAPATPKLEAITANSTTPYITAFTDLRKGPVVLEVPAASAEGSVYGQVVDAWQFTIADVGPSGLDKGHGARFLLTAPGFKSAIPKGYLHVASPNFRIALAFRFVLAPGKTATDAYQYARRLKMYTLAEAAHRSRSKGAVEDFNRCSITPSLGWCFRPVAGPRLVCANVTVTSKPPFRSHHLVGRIWKGTGSCSLAFMLRKDQAVHIRRTGCRSLSATPFNRFYVKSGTSAAMKWQRAGAAHLRPDCPVSLRISRTDNCRKGHT